MRWHRALRNLDRKITTGPTFGHPPGLLIMPSREDKKGRFVRFLKNCSFYPGRYECFDSLTGFRSVRFATAQGYSRIYQTGRASLVAKEFAIRYRNERIGWGLASLARRYAVPARSGCRHLRSHFEKRRQTPSHLLVPGRAYSSSHKAPRQRTRIFVAWIRARHRTTLAPGP